MPQKPSLLKADPILFSPLYLNAKKVSTEKLLALYRFSNLFFPQMAPNLMRTIADMERYAERLSADSTPEERKKLIREMNGLNIEIQYVLRDAGQKVMEISIHINPSEVLERAQQGKIDLIQYQKLSDDLDKIIVKMIVREIRRRFTVRVMDFFHTFLNSKQVPPFIAQLLDMSWINHKGQLMQGATIDDILIGKYREQFERLMPGDLLHEGMQIRETIRTCFEIGQESDDSLIRDAKKRHALLEIVIRESNKAV